MHRVPSAASVHSASALATRYRTVRSHTEQLAAPLSPEDQCAQSMPDASPVKWHRAHTSWFFETFVLRPAGIQGLSPEPFQTLFNSYYNGVGEQFHRPSRGLLTRPSCEEVSAYRRRVDHAMLQLIEGGIDAKMGAVVELGLHHEQQHQELLLTDTKHLFAHNPLYPVYAAQGALEPRAVAGDAVWVQHPEGMALVGHAGAGFAFDNEGPQHRVYLPAFALRDRLVTNAEYLAFMEDAGYQRPELWLSDGWQAVRQNDWQAPLYWRRDDAGWQRFGLHGVTPLSLEAPVSHVSHYEADAFARWAQARLPTEAEWEVWATTTGATESDAHGCCWQWTASAYTGYPGYCPPEGAVGEYNGKFMSGQMTLRGSSCVTPAGHARSTYRNFFPPHARWQFSGIRLARDIP